MKISLYGRVHLKTIPWKFPILNPNNSWVSYLWSLDLVYFTTGMPDTSNMSEIEAIQVQHECNTSATMIKQVQYDCNMNDTYAIRVKNFLKIFIFFCLKKFIILDFVNFHQQIRHGWKLCRAINREFKHLDILFIPRSKKNHTYSPCWNIHKKLINGVP